MKNKKNLAVSLLILLLPLLIPWLEKGIFLNFTYAFPEADKAFAHFISLVFMYASLGGFWFWFTTRNFK